MERTIVIVLRVQSMLYVVTGAWPILHRESFAPLTNPAADPLEMHAFAALSVALGLFLWRMSASRERLYDGALLSALSACAIAAVEWRYWPLPEGSLLRIDLLLELLFFIVSGYFVLARRVG